MTHVLFLGKVQDSRFPFSTTFRIIAKMIGDEAKKKLQDIVRGAFFEGQQDHCTTIRNLLCQSFGTDPTLKSEFESRAIIKEKQVAFLKSHCDKNGCIPVDENN